ncbi:UNVERIFIED_CONTAM: hypothetical protein PYX00_000355 [Menopon gallinae]|uniref:Uncharacterized protein n=1 Tax=Menopon gallinae TaxID=328185 RepID=A0AAW2I9M2_9NEOP
MEPTSGQCGVQPSFIFLLVTLLVTSLATAMLCAAIMTEHWEYITWDRGKLEEIERQINNSTGSGRNEYKIEWLLDGQVARVLLGPKPKEPRRQNIYNFALEEEKLDDDRPALFFVPVHGGIWTLCITLDDRLKMDIIRGGLAQINVWPNRCLSLQEADQPAQDEA